MVPMRRFLLIWLTLTFADSEEGGVNIPVLENVKSITFERVLEVTSRLTTPVILKSFVDTSMFAQACSCDPSATLFDSFAIPYDEGNVRQKIFTASFTGAPYSCQGINAGEFFRNKACAKRDDYVFYDRADGAAEAPDIRLWFDTIIGPLLNVSQTIDSPEFDMPWYNEIFIGYSSAHYPTPGTNRPGTGPHREPVLNYYYQICGAKQWHVAAANATHGEPLRRLAQLVREEDVSSFLAHPSTLRGVTEPGDLLINPPWAWHAVQTAVGFNFAVTYKKTGFQLWSDFERLDAVHLRDSGVVPLLQHPLLQYAGVAFKLPPLDTIDPDYSRIKSRIVPPTTGGLGLLGLFWCYKVMSFWHGLALHCAAHAPELLVTAVGALCLRRSCCWARRRATAACRWGRPKAA